MKLALLKLCFLTTVAALTAPTVHAQVKMKYPAATFDADETKPATHSAKLHASGTLNDTPPPSAATIEPPVATETPVAITQPAVAETTVAEAPQPAIAEPAPEPATIIAAAEQPTEPMPFIAEPVVTAKAASAPMETPVPPPSAIAETSTPQIAAPVSNTRPPRRPTVDADGWPIETPSTHATASSAARSAPGTEKWPGEQYPPSHTAEPDRAASSRTIHKSPSPSRQPPAPAQTRVKATLHAKSAASPAATSAPAPVAIPASIASGAEPPSDSAGINNKMTFRIQAGERMSDVFARWANATGWQITWEPEDIVAMADLNLDDTLMGAVTKVIDALNRGGANIQARFYDANHMLRIMARK